jgi:putative transcriptional regulator
MGGQNVTAAEKKQFFIEGLECTCEPYHYRASGLDNVYLVNGFRPRETSYGTGVTIENVEALHRAIGYELITQQRALSPREFRFLRKQMGFTQQELADRLRLDEQTIGRYEKEQTAIPGPVDLTIRMLFVLYHMPADQRESLLEEIKEHLDRDETVDDEAIRPLHFQQTQAGWETNARH